MSKKKERVTMSKQQLYTEIMHRILMAGIHDESYCTRFAQVANDLLQRYALLDTIIGASQQEREPSCDSHMEIQIHEQQRSV